MKFVPNAVSTKFARQLLKTQKGSPTILFAAGVVGMVGTVVLASKATLKLEETLDEITREQNVVKFNAGSKQEMALVQIKAVGKVTKLYAPALAVGTLSICALTGSHVTLTRRNVGLTAAYATVDKAFKEYRERVLGEVGEKKERELYYNLEKCEIEDEDGKKKTVKKIADAGLGMYAKFFGPDSSSWSPSQDNNLIFLRAQQNYANNRLQAVGHVFLNEIYDNLGLERTSAGAVVGWIKGEGDDYVDFGIFDSPNNDRLYDFVTSRDGVWLDFNVDGVIYDRI